MLEDEWLAEGDASASLDVDADESPTTMFLSAFAETTEKVTGKEPEVALLTLPDQPEDEDAPRVFMITYSAGRLEVNIQIHELTGQDGEDGIGVGVRIHGLPKAPRIPDNCEYVQSVSDEEGNSLILQTVVSAQGSVDFAISHAELVAHLASLYARMTAAPKRPVKR